MRIVVALGGNALQKNKEASADAQKAIARETARQLAAIVAAGHELVVAHGNGPQVGNILLHEEAINTVETPTSPLDTCVAMSQGQIGYWLQQALNNELEKQGSDASVAAIITQAVVSLDDPAFGDPSKPIGPFYPDQTAAEAAAAERGFIVKEDAGRGWRRVVASPKPLDVVEKKFISQALEQGNIVIAGGGGGIPVVHEEGELKGVEAVIDKDFAAAKIAELVEADTLLILTGVSAVSINFNTPDEQDLGIITVEDMQKHAWDGQFAPGSMLPKIEAALQFTTRGPNHQTIITSPENALEALSGNIGTHIVNSLT